jgi:hypothetical protein
MVAADVPPPNSSWWRRYWDSFKRNFPDRSGEQARSLVLVLLAFVSLFLLARIFFAVRGLLLRLEQLIKIPWKIISIGTRKWRLSVVISETCVSGGGKLHAKPCVRRL